MFLRQDTHWALPTTNHTCSACCSFADFSSVEDTLVQYQGAPDMEDVPKGNVKICKYHHSIMFQRYANNLQSNHRHQAQKWIHRDIFVEHLLIEMSQCWSYAVHTSDVALSMLLIAGWIIERGKRYMIAKCDAMDSNVLSTCSACCTIQLLCHMISPLHCPLQLPAFETLSRLDQR
jgi:hypothetical protein